MQTVKLNGGIETDYRLIDTASYQDETQVDTPTTIEELRNAKTLSR